MAIDRVREALAASLEDLRLSRGERQALGALLAEMPSGFDRAEVRRLAFALAADATVDPVARSVVAWLEAVVKVLDRPEEPAAPTAFEALFSPGQSCPRRVVGLIGESRAHVEVCVFTITDDRIAEALLTAHDRGVAVRVITDDEKASDVGSDVPRLRDAGVPVRVDRSPFHMHHKFALFDRRTLLTGSYNWTRGASENNEENLVVLGDPGLVSRFSERFERLWEKLGARRDGQG
jgi:phosphatidylserine/phosphatidylglycerophosphate/cardiolipin synthase-like enzyme